MPSVLNHYVFTGMLERWSSTPQCMVMQQVSCGDLTRLKFCMLTCTLNNLTRVIQQFSNILPSDMLGRSWNLSFQAQACLTDWVDTGTVLEMVTSEAAVGIIKGPLSLSISMGDSLCVPAGLGPQPKVCSCSWCQSCANFLILCSLSSPPPYLPR